MRDGLPTASKRGDVRLTIMKQYNKALCAALLAGFIGSLIIGLIMLSKPGYASVPAAEEGTGSVSDDFYTLNTEESTESVITEDNESGENISDTPVSEAHSTLYYELKAKAESLIAELKSVPDIKNEEQRISVQQYCLTIYTDFSELFDSADKAYEDGSTDNTEYASLIEMLNDYGNEVSSEFERLGFDPYATELAYSLTVSSDYISEYVTAYNWSASYNGSNIIINFNFSIGIVGRLHRIFIGSGGELLTVDAYGYSHATNKPSEGVQYFSCSYGKVTLSSISMGAGRTTASGYITITNPSGFKSWYNSNSRALRFTSYSDSSTDYEYLPDSTTGMNPTNITNVSTAITQGTCSHSYSCTSVNASTHKTACTKCGYVKGTGSHNSSVTDTSSSPGYTLKKCSSCGYKVSSTSNKYSVVIDMGTGDASDNITITASYNQSMPDITVPSRLGYTFLGCYSGTNGSGTQYYLDTGKSAHVYNLAKAATIYAHWKRNCTITKLPALKNEFACVGS